MRLLALDQASRTTGWAVFEDNKLYDYGKFTFEDKDFGIRLNNIRKEIFSLIEKYQIDELAFEDIQFQSNIGNNVDTFKKLAEVFGIVYELATDLNLPNRAILSTTWKSVLGVKGRDRAAQKKNAQDWVLNTYNIKAIQDTVDAICIGEAYLRTK